VAAVGESNFLRVQTVFSFTAVTSFNFLVLQIFVAVGWAKVKTSALFNCC